MADSHDTLALVELHALMARGPGAPTVRVGLIDGPVAVDHPGLATERIVPIRGAAAVRCARPEGAACAHGTFVAGILGGRRGSGAPAICPGCTLLVRPIFPEASADGGPAPAATPEELAAAIVDCVSAGARVVNLSLALALDSDRDRRALHGALDHAMRHGVLVVAAAGNRGAVSGSAITRHPWVLPVAACDLQGRPAAHTNLGTSIGRGLRAPGTDVTSLGARGDTVRSSGTSIAAAFVTGAIALLLSEFPAANAGLLKRAILLGQGPRRPTVVPALLNAGAAYQALATTLPR